MQKKCYQALALDAYGKTLIFSCENGEMFCLGGELTLARSSLVCFLRKRELWHGFSGIVRRIDSGFYENINREYGNGRNHEELNIRTYCREARWTVLWDEDKKQQCITSVTNDQSYGRAFGALFVPIVGVKEQHHQ